MMCVAKQIAHNVYGKQSAFEIITGIRDAVVATSKEHG